MAITITNEDNMDLMARYEDNHFDLAIVDPPYGIGRDKWDVKPADDYWKELWRVSKKQIVWGGNYFNLPVTESWMCWDKTNNGKSFFKHKAKFELIWFSFDVKPDFIRYTLDGNVQGFKARPNYNKQKAIHSCQKPVKLYEWILMNYAKEGDKILDTHLGSGSIAIACHNLGYDLTACELDKEYYEAAIKRLDQHRAQIRMF